MPDVPITDVDVVYPDPDNNEHPQQNVEVDAAHLAKLTAASNEATEQ